MAQQHTLNTLEYTAEHVSVSQHNCSMHVLLVKALTHVMPISEAIDISEMCMADGFTTETVYFSGMNLDECVAPMPGLPCFTGL